MKKITKRIACIGECMVELQEDISGNMRQGFAGDTFNTALYLSRLLPDDYFQVSYVTALGTDPFSRGMIASWQSEGINCDFVRRFEGLLPGLYLVDLDPSGERSFHYWRDQAAARHLFDGTSFDSKLTVLSTFDYLYFSGISLAILSPENRLKLLMLIEKARINHCKICFDNNFRASLWESKAAAQEWYKKALAVTDLALLTDDDEQQLWGTKSPQEIFLHYENLNIGEIVLKRGSAPCIVKTANTQVAIDAVTIPTDKVIDTNAAGDSFSAAYIANRIASPKPPVECAKAAHSLAGTVIQHRGAIIPHLSMEKHIANVFKH